MAQAEPPRLPSRLPLLLVPPSPAPRPLAASASLAASSMRRSSTASSPWTLRGFFGAAGGVCAPCPAGTSAVGGGDVGLAVVSGLLA